MRASLIIARCSKADGKEKEEDRVFFKVNSAEYRGGGGKAVGAKSTSSVSVSPAAIWLHI